MARRVRRYGRNAVRFPLRRVAATVGLGLRNSASLGERHTPKRHRQRQHQRRDQQRKSLSHFFSPPFLIQKQKPAYIASCSCGGCSRLRYWLCPLLSAHLYESELLSL